MPINERNYNPAKMYGADVGNGVDNWKLLDNNGNEVVDVDGVTSAVNYVRITNAATGGDPEISVQGDDTNADLLLTPLGQGIVFVGNRDSGTIVSGSVTINAQRGRLVTTALSAASATVQNFDLINNRIIEGSQLLFTLDRWTGSAGQPVVTYGTTVTGRATFAILNVPVPQAGSAQLNGTAAIRFVVL